MHDVRPAHTNVFLQFFGQSFMLVAVQQFVLLTNLTQKMQQKNFIMRQ